MTSACETCGGTGEVEIRVYEGGEWDTFTEECPDCDGAGPEEPAPAAAACAKCGDTGLYRTVGHGARAVPECYCECPSGERLWERDYAAEEERYAEANPEPYETDGEQAQAWFASAYGHGEDDYEPADPYEGGW